MNEAEARAFVGKKLRLGSPCPRNTTSHSNFQALQAKDAPPATCDRCGTTGYGKGRLDDWHLEDLLAAMEAAGWILEARAGKTRWRTWAGWCFSQYLHHNLMQARNANPIIAAALALQAKEASDDQRQP